MSLTRRFIRVDIKDPAPRWYWDVEERRRDVMLDGKLFLITNVPGLDAREALRRHTGLADIEGRFRVLKSEIEIAPVEHRVPGRIRAHTSICFPALVIHPVMRWTIKEKGCPFSAEYVLEKLKAVQHHGFRPATGVSSVASPRSPRSKTLLRGHRRPATNQREAPGAAGEGRLPHPVQQYQQPTPLTVELGGSVASVRGCARFGLTEAPWSAA